MRNGMNVHTDKKRGNKDKWEYPLPGMGCKCTRVGELWGQAWEVKLEDGLWLYSI